MIKLNLTLNNTNDQSPLTLLLTGNFSVTKLTETVNGKPMSGSCINDGVHNNGGWKVKESYEQVLKMIDAQVIAK